MPELNKTQGKLIHKVYFQDKVQVGRDKLWAYIRNKYPQAKISQRQVMNWLKKVRGGSTVVDLKGTRPSTISYSRNLLSGPRL